MNKIRYVALLLLSGIAFCFIMDSCSAAPRRKQKKRRKAKTTAVQNYEPIRIETDTPWGTMMQELISYGETLLGKPYRYRGVRNWTLDCSGYVSLLYSRLGIKIPRSSAGLSRYVQRIQEPKPGDLAFFTGRSRRSGRVGHVALVVENKDGEVTIMHSTNSRGIIRHKIKSDAYFSSRFLHFGRLPEVEQTLQKSDSTLQLSTDSIK